MANGFSRHWAEVLAKKLGTTLNAETERVDEVLEGLNRTSGFCPCVPKIFHNKETRCPCTEMKTYGHCHCNLYNNRRD